MSVFFFNRGRRGRLYVLASALFFAACGDAPTQPQPGAPPPPPAVDPATAGSLSGQVTLDGPAPPAQVIRMDADRKCVEAAQGEERRTEDIVVNDGKLQNVFVYIKEGLPQRMYLVPTQPVTLDQQKCRYVPRVLGVQVGQPVEVVNSDALLHNVHAEGAVNRPFDVGQPLKGIKTTHTFTTREVMIPVKCQVHAWMRGYIGVIEHPFFAVTDAAGRFSIPQLPPGTYTIEAWHERLGTRTGQMTIGPKDAKTLDFTFKAS